MFAGTSNGRRQSSARELTSVKLGDDEYEVGDDVYMALEDYEFEEEEDEACEVRVLVARKALSTCISMATAAKYHTMLPLRLCCLTPQLDKIQHASMECVLGWCITVACADHPSAGVGCQVCDRTALLTGMLECSCCLRGFHLKCLRPPLRKVPEGDWLCPQCDAGEVAPKPRRLMCSWQKLLYGDRLLSLAHIVGFSRGTDPEGEEE